MTGLKINRSYLIGMGLCAQLLLMQPAAAEIKKPDISAELRQAYSQLFLQPQAKQRQAGNAAAQRSKYSNSRQRVILSAKKQLRKRYRWGGTSPKTGFDCSGLIQYAFKSIKIHIPRTAREQYRKTKRIALSKLRAGDLIFFHTRRTRTRVNHVGLYLGDGKFIHAPRRGKRVSVAKFNKYWRRKAVGAGRV